MKIVNRNCKKKTAVIPTSQLLPMDEKHKRPTAKDWWIGDEQDEIF